MLNCYKNIDNVEIGNGYGVPGGGAYYAAKTLNIQTGEFHFIKFFFSKQSMLQEEFSDFFLNLLQSEAKDENHESSLAVSKDARKELPDYLKQRLKARGILKDEKANVEPTTTKNVCLSLI